MQTRIIVCGIIQNKNKILLGKKHKGRPPYPDVWHTLGGGIKDQKMAIELIKEKQYENPLLHNELIREIKEEASISIKNIKNICPNFRKKPREAITENKNNIRTHYIFLEFICDLDKGSAKPGDDIAKLKWVDKKNLKNIKLTPPSQKMYKELNWL